MPFALLLPVVATELSDVIWGYGAAEATSANYAPTLALFAPGVLFFTVHYLMLRGFYALERTRTVFWVQCLIAAVNISLAVLLVGRTDAVFTSPALVLSYAGAYAVGAVASYSLLRHLLGGLRTPALVRFGVRMLLTAGPAALVAWGAAWALHTTLGDHLDSKAGSVLFLAAVGLVDGVAYLLLARLLRLTEVTEVVETVTRRLRLPGRV